MNKGDWLKVQLFNYLSSRRGRGGDECQAREDECKRGDETRQLWNKRKFSDDFMRREICRMM